MRTKRTKRTTRTKRTKRTKRTNKTKRTRRTKKTRRTRRSRRTRRMRGGADFSEEDRIIQEALQKIQELETNISVLNDKLKSGVTLVPIDESKHRDLTRELESEKTIIAEAETQKAVKQKEHNIERIRQMIAGEQGGQARPDQLIKAHNLLIKLINELPGVRGTDMVGQESDELIALDSEVGRLQTKQTRQAEITAEIKQKEGLITKLEEFKKKAKDEFNKQKTATNIATLQGRVETLREQYAGL